jgi:hypothetical protein
VTRLRAFGAGLWDFIVGDDWLTAVGVVAAIAVTALVASGGVAAWWITPVAVVVLLVRSVRAAARG